MRKVVTGDRFTDFFLTDILKDELRIFSFSEKKKKKEKPHQER